MTVQACNFQSSYMTSDLPREVLHYSQVREYPARTQILSSPDR